MQGSVAQWIRRLATLCIAFALAVFLLYHWIQPAVSYPWQKWAWVVCAALVLAVPVGWLVFRFVQPKLDLFSARGRVTWIVGSLLAGVLLVKAIPLACAPAWIPSQEKAATAGAATQPLASADTSASRHIWKALVLRACDAMCLAFPLLVVSLWLVTRREGATVQPGRWAWLGYSASCALVWSYYLWVFWPGLMSFDSFIQWFQMSTGRITNYHPAFHTMTNWLITRVWNSPAAIAIAQIIILSAVVGWGLTRMRQKGMPRWLAAAICLAMALSPANGATVVTLWKDVLYSTCLLLLGLLVIEIVVSKGAWIEQRWAWVFLGITAALTALYRHNGPPVALGTLVVLLPVYWQKWRRLALASSLAAGCWLAVQGPLYNITGVQPTSTGFKLMPMLHHLAAHTNADAPLLTENERKLLAAVHPLVDGKWPYDPTNVTLLYNKKINFKQLDTHRAELFRLFLSLTWRQPLVSLKHIINNSAMVWRITRSPGFCLMLGCDIVNNKAMRLNPEIRNDPKQGIGGPLVEVQRPVPPGLAISLSPKWSWLVWQPAIWLYLLLLGVIVAAVRAWEWQYLLLALPAGLQSFCLALVCPSFDMRYQWGVCMTGVLVGGFGLWCAPRRIKACANKLLAGEGPGDGQPMPKKSGQDPAIYFSGCGATQSARRQRASLDAARYDDVAVLVPCYNEELSIAKVVRDFRAALPGATIYVFDNNSTDRTAELAWQSGAQVVPSPCQGKGHVVRHMFDAVDANLYLMVDGDDTYRADAAPELIALARAGGADMVVGTRLEQFQGGSFRRFHCLGNRLIGRLLRAVFRVRVTDVLSGYRVFSREFVRSVPVMSPRFEIETELTLHAVAKKFIILEHPVPYGERPQGSQSKLNTFRDGYHILKTIFLIFKDYKPFTFFGFIALVIAALSLLAGLPAIVDYATTSKVWHLPSAVLAASLAVISTLCLVIGLLLHTLRNYHNENMELFRRCISQMDKLRGDISPDTSAIDARNAAHSLSYMRIKLKDPAEPAEEEYSVGHE